MVLEGHIKNLAAVPVLPHGLWPLNLVRGVTYYKKFHPIKLHNLLTTWPREATWQIRNILYPLQHYGHNTMATKLCWMVKYNEYLPSIKLHDSLITCFGDFDFFLQCVGSERKFLSSHRLLVIAIIVKCSIVLF